MSDRRFPSVDRVLVGAFAALVVARPLVDAADPGRLRLTTGTGPVSFNLVLFALLGIAAVRRAIYGGPRLGRSALVPLLLLGVAVVAVTGTSMGERYARPGLFIAWEWAALAAAFVLARVLTPSAEDARGVRNVLVASVVSIAGLGIYQAVASHTGLPSTDPPAAGLHSLAGDAEYDPPAAAVRPPTGTLDSPDTFGVLCLLTVVGLSGLRSPVGGRLRRILIVVLLIAWGLAAYAVLQLRREAGPLDLDHAVQVLRDNPILGTGVGNWTRVTGEAAEPPMAWLALAATAGVVGLGLLLGSMVVSIGVLAKRPLPEAWSVPAAMRPRWEFHLGGVAGLVLGFVWAAGALPADAPSTEVFRLATTALFRAAIWIAVFSALESARPPVAVNECTGWAFGLIIFGLVAAGTGRFTVLFPTFVCLALAYNLRPAPGETPARRAAFGSIGLTVLALALVIGHLVTAGVPAYATASAVRQARLASRLYPDLERQIDQASAGGPQTTARTKARNFLIGNILIPLEDATSRDPKNSALWLELARWRRALWKVQLYLDPEGKIPGRIAADALAAADRAGELDPRNPAPLRSRFESLLLFRRLSDHRPKDGKADERLEDLRQTVAGIAAREPGAEIGLRFRIVDLLLVRRDFTEASREIVTVLGLNRVEGSPHGRLSDEQMADLVARVRMVNMIPPQELLDEMTKK